MQCPYSLTKVCPEKAQADCGSCPEYQSSAVDTEEEFETEDDEDQDDYEGQDDELDEDDTFTIKPD